MEIIFYSFLILILCFVLFFFRSKIPPVLKNRLIGTPHLRVMQQIYVDSKTRLIEVVWHKNTYLILMTPTSAMVIDKNHVPQESPS